MCHHTFGKYLKTNITVIIFLIKRYFLVFTIYAMISNLVFFCALIKMLDLDANICALGPTSLLYDQVRAAVL